MPRRRSTPDQIIRKLTEGQQLLAAGTELDAVCPHRDIAESTWRRWTARYGEEGRGGERLKDLEVLGR